MLWLILIPFAAAVVVPLLHHMLRGYVAVIAALVPIGLGVAIVRQLPLDPAFLQLSSTPWVPAFGVELAFRLDGLSATFALLITGIGALILLYAAAYMRDDPKLGRLCGFLLMFLGAMLGVVFSDDLFVLFVFWELTSIASYLLIGFKHDKLDARNAARQALLVTGAGGLALLAGFILLGQAAVQAGVPFGQSSRISALVGSELSQSALFAPAMCLIVLGAFSKSAQMPLHFWLPNAMAAPTPVSAYLHSATMVKAGVFLLARMNPVFGESMLWHVLLTVTGATTMLIAAGMAAGQSDLKRILAYTTVSVLGTLTMLIGVGTDLAIKAAVVYLVAHACYKAALFMIAGSLEYATGTRDVHELGGLFRAMPLTAASGMLAALSMAGAPPLFGFIGKELLLKAKLDLEFAGVVLILVASLANVFLIAMALVVAVRPFFGPRKPVAKSVREVPLLMLLGPLVLAVTGLFVGLIPGTFDSALGSAMASAIGGRVIVMKLTLWHGFSPTALTALGISIITLAAGLSLFLRMRERFADLASTVARMGTRGPGRAYDWLLSRVLQLAGDTTRLTQTGSLHQYVRVLLIVLLAVCVYPLARCFPLGRMYEIGWQWHELALVLLTVAGALAAVFARSRLSAVAMLGITGILIAILFALFSAPDLAITQIMVEALTVVLLVLVFHRLPAFTRLRTPRTRLLDAVIAVAAGGVMTGLVLASASLHLPTDVCDHLVPLAKPEAYGRNVVNVILVDFRALDTLGELTVVAAAGLGVYALVKLSVRSRAGGEDA